jgi:hypothetical protein
VRFAERRGAYQITVFTSPTLFRAGPVDISVLIQDGATGEPVPHAQVTIQATPRSRADQALRVPATTEAATNKLLYAAAFDLPAPGWWDIEVMIDGPRGPARVAFEVQADDAPPPWRALWPWFCWPPAVVVLYVIHQLLSRRAPR